MATLADLDAAIAAQTTEVATLTAAVEKVDADITALLAKIAGGGAVDVTAELTAIQANTTAITAAVTAAQAADVAANPPA